MSEVPFALVDGLRVYNHTPHPVRIFRGDQVSPHPSIRGKFVPIPGAEPITVPPVEPTAAVLFSDSWESPRFLTRYVESSNLGMIPQEGDAVRIVSFPAFTAGKEEGRRDLCCPGSQVVSPDDPSKIVGCVGLVMA